MGSSAHSDVQQFADADADAVAVAVAVAAAYARRARCDTRSAAMRCSC